MSARIPEIGFSSQRLRYEWVRHVALLGMAGMKGETLTVELDRYLGDCLSSAGENKRGSREKAITILKRIWDPDANHMKPMRKDGFGFLQSLPDAQHLAVHWGMTMASYPYWYATGTCVGRLLRLQGITRSSQIRRRMQEIYGDREIVARATRNVVRSFISWCVLQETGEKGIYSAGTSLAIEDSKLIAWLTEAALHARTNDSAALRELLESPGFFPFRIKPIQAESLVASSTRIEIIRHGLDNELVMLRK
jgi:hypothetical protein